MEQAQQQHKHDIVYYGVVNLIRDAIVIGTIDIWRCRGCPDIFCEDKRFGLTDLAPEVGFPKVGAGEKWAALICSKDKGSEWTLTGAIPGKVLAHSCTPETKLELRIASDYSLEPSMASGIGSHRIIILEKFVNTAVDVLSGRLHTGPTNANPAPGRPFSFATEKGAVAEPTMLNVPNIASASFFIAGVWSLIIGGIMLSEPVSRTGFVLAAALGLAGGYFTLTKKNAGPLLGLAAGIVGTIGLFQSGIFSQNIGNLALLLLLLASIGLAWVARSRIKSMTEQRWHPLDMPAYG